MKFHLLLFALVVKTQGITFSPPDMQKELNFLKNNDFAGYAALHGFNLTYYNAVTDDGWIIQLWRVQSPDIINATLSTPVIVSHGFGSSAFDYLLNLRNQSIAFVLADNGYDVWLANYRATQFSNSMLRNGEAKDPEVEDYYRASWQYMAEEDFPSIIDKVLSETGQEKVYLIGHSMGTTVPFAFLSEDHTYDNTILHFAAVVPVLKFGYDTSLALLLALITAPPLVPIIIQPLFGGVFGRQILASTGNNVSDFSSFLTSAVCATPLTFLVCNLGINLLFNRDLLATVDSDPHLNQTRKSIYLNKTPGGLTAMNAYNYGQQWRKQPWTKLDYRNVYQTGTTNMKEYGSKDPPAYNFTALEVPFSLYYVNNDVFTGRSTRAEVIAMLKATDVTIINGNDFSHIDSVVGIDTRCYTIDSILSKFKVLESNRDPAHASYRNDVETFLSTLPFENGCIGLPS